MLGPEDYGAVTTINAATGTGSLCSVLIRSGNSICSVQIATGLTGTVVFEATQDNGQTWNSVNLIKSDFTIASSVVNPGAIKFFFPCGGYSGFRVRCSAFTSGSAVVQVVASTANANMSGVFANTLTLSLGGTSPAAPSTVVGTSQTGLDCFTKCVVYSVLQGATGGALDVVLQSTPDAGATWYDVCHFTQLAAAAGAVGYFVSITRGETYSGTAPIVVNSVAGTPVLAAGQVIPHGLGNGLRVVYVAGASTSAGAAQTITVMLSTQ